jgi:hypothetical protein
MPILSGNTMHAVGLTAELTEGESSQLANMVETTVDGAASTTQPTTLSPDQIKTRQQQLLNEKNNVRIYLLLHCIRNSI